MVALVAHCLVALVHLQTTSTASTDMVRVNVSGQLDFGQGSLSVMVPSNWEHRVKERVVVKKDATYERGSFGLEASPSGQKRIGVSVSRLLRPDSLSSNVRETSLKNLVRLAEMHEKDFIERGAKYANAPVKVGEFSGNLMEFVMFPGQYKVRVKYDVLLRNKDQEYIYISMQSYVSKPDPADRKLFLEIVNSIKVP